MIINNNISAKNTNRLLSISSKNSSKNLEKLSSGLRINRAGDDAAGLAISEKMRAQVRGLTQSARNAQDSISLIQTAEGALGQTHDLLQRIRELSVQAANDTNTSDDRQGIQAEVEQLVSEVDRIANTTEFNTKKLLDGSAKGSQEKIDGQIRISNNSKITIPATTKMALQEAAKTVAVDGAFMVARVDNNGLEQEIVTSLSNALSTGQKVFKDTKTQIDDVVSLTTKLQLTKPSIQETALAINRTKLDDNQLQAIRDAAVQTKAIAYNAVEKAILANNASQTLANTAVQSAVTAANNFATVTAPNILTAAHTTATTEKAFVVTSANNAVTAATTVANNAFADVNLGITAAQGIIDIANNGINNAITASTNEKNTLETATSNALTATDTSRTNLLAVRDATYLDGLTTKADLPTALNPLRADFGNAAIDAILADPNITTLADAADQPTSEAAVVAAVNNHLKAAVDYALNQNASASITDPALLSAVLSAGVNADGTLNTAPTVISSAAFTTALTPLLRTEALTAATAAGNNATIANNISNLTVTASATINSAATIKSNATLINNVTTASKTAAAAAMTTSDLSIRTAATNVISTGFTANTLAGVQSNAAFANAVQTVVRANALAATDPSLPASLRTAIANASISGVTVTADITTNPTYINELVSYVRNKTNTAALGAGATTTFANAITPLIVDANSTINSTATVAATNAYKGAVNTEMRQIAQTTALANGLSGTLSAIVYNTILNTTIPPDNLAIFTNVIDKTVYQDALTAELQNEAYLVTKANGVSENVAQATRVLIQTDGDELKTSGGTVIDDLFIKTDSGFQAALTTDMRNSSIQAGIASGGLESLVRIAAEITTDPSTSIVPDIAAIRYNSRYQDAVLSAIETQITTMSKQFRFDANLEKLLLANSEKFAQASNNKTVDLILETMRNNQIFQATELANKTIADQQLKESILPLLLLDDWGTVNTTETIYNTPAIAQRTLSLALAKTEQTIDNIIPATSNRSELISVLKQALLNSDSTALDSANNILDKAPVKQQLEIALNKAMDNEFILINNLGQQTPLDFSDNGQLDLSKHVLGLEGAGATLPLAFRDMQVGETISFVFSKAEAADLKLEAPFLSQIGANSGQFLNIGIAGVDTNTLGITNLNLTNKFTAQAAIEVTNNAIIKVSRQRSVLGAVQNRLEHTISNLGTAAENLSSSESRIRDLDMAKEMHVFQKNNVLNQVAQAMLAQANQTPQAVVQLLR